MVQHRLSFFLRFRASQSSVSPKIRTFEKKKERKTDLMLCKRVAQLISYGSEKSSWGNDFRRKKKKTLE